MITPRERMRTVLSGKIPDRVPFHPTIYTDHACLALDRRFEEAIINPGFGMDCMLEAALLYQTDAVRFLAGPDASWYDDNVVAEEDGKLVQRDRRTGQAEGYYDVAGGGAFFPYDPPVPVRTMAQVRAI